MDDEVAFLFWILSGSLSIGQASTISFAISFTFTFTFTISIAVSFALHFILLSFFHGRGNDLGIFSLADKNRGVG